jgi:hypothetical protein
MTGLNYAATRRSTFDPLAGLREASRRLRIAAALWVLAVAGVAFVSAGEQHRLAVLDDQLAAVRSTAAGVAVAAGRAAASSARFDRLRQQAARLAAARRETIASSNAAILAGNALPPRTWLVQLDAGAPGRWTLAGKSMTLAEIGTTLRALQRLDSRSTVRLVSVSANARPGRPFDFIITRESAR